MHLLGVMTFDLWAEIVLDTNNFVFGAYLVGDYFHITHTHNLGGVDVVYLLQYC